MDHLQPPSFQERFRQAKTKAKNCLRELDASLDYLFDTVLSEPSTVAPVSTTSKPSDSMLNFADQIASTSKQFVKNLKTLKSLKSSKFLKSRRRLDSILRSIDQGIGLTDPIDDICARSDAVCAQFDRDYRNLTQGLTPRPSPRIADKSTADQVAASDNELAKSMAVKEGAANGEDDQEEADAWEDIESIEENFASEEEEESEESVDSEVEVEISMPAPIVTASMEHGLTIMPPPSSFKRLPTDDHLSVASTSRKKRKTGKENSSAVHQLRSSTPIQSPAVMMPPGTSSSIATRHLSETSKRPVKFFNVSSPAMPIPRPPPPPPKQTRPSADRIPDEQMYRTIFVNCIDSICAGTFPSKQDLNRHLSEEHGILLFQCPLVDTCGASFDNEALWNQHCVTNHSGITSWQCFTCPRAFSKHYSLNYHIYMNHMEGKFQCSKLGCTYVDRFRGFVCDHYQCVHMVQEEYDQLVTKMKNLAGIQGSTRGSFQGAAQGQLGPLKGPGFKGTVYGQSTSGPKAPVQRVSPGRASYQRPSSIVRYLTRSLKCIILGCGQCFDNKLELHIHLKTHHNVPPERCPLKNCRRLFEHRYLLEAHFLMAHQGLRKWPCPQCRKVCDDGRQLNGHMFVAHQEGQFVCSFEGCKYSSVFRIEVMDHYNKEHERKVAER